MGKALIIGAGGVAGVVIHKCCQNSEVFTEICIASRTKSKCDKFKEELQDKTATKITTAQVDANDVDQLIALIEQEKPDIVINVALPYQDLTIMDACLATKTDYVDTANYEPEDTAKFEYKWQWAYRERFEKAGITALLGSGFDPFWTATAVTTAILSLPTSIRKSIFGKFLQRAVTSKTANGWKPNLWKSSENTTSIRLAKRICTCCTTKNWNLWH